MDDDLILVLRVQIHVGGSHSFMLPRNSPIIGGVRDPSNLIRHEGYPA